jgi:Cu-processing system permease protein
MTVHEAISRRLILAGLVLSVTYAGLYALGFSFASSKLVETASSAQARLAVNGVIAGLPALGLYVVYFMAAFLALFLSVGGVSSEIDAGTLHAIMARPLRRSEFLLGRWLAYLLILAGYLALMVGLVLGASHVIAGVDVPQPLKALGLMILGPSLLMTVALLGSTLMPTLANGVVVFTLLGLSWLGGMIEWLGLVISNDAMVNLATVVSLIMPSDAIWRGASYYLQSPLMLAATSGVAARAIPFLSNTPPTTALLLWSVGYLVVVLAAAIVSFRTRDL